MPRPAGTARSDRRTLPRPGGAGPRWTSSDRCLPWCLDGCFDLAVDAIGEQLVQQPLEQRHDLDIGGVLQGLAAAELSPRGERRGRVFSFGWVVVPPVEPGVSHATSATCSVSPLSRRAYSSAIFRLRRYEPCSRTER